MSNLSVISTPPPVALLGEGLKFTLRNTSYSPGDKANVELLFGGTYADYSDGQTFTLTASGQTIIFTFKSSPNDSLATDIQAGVSSETADDILNRVMAVFRQHFFLNENYVFSENDSGHLSIEARNTGETFNIELTASDIAVLTGSQAGQGSDSTLPGDFAFYLALADHKKGIDAEPEGEDLLLPRLSDLYYEVQNNLADYARRLLTTGFSWPFFDSNIIIWPEAVAAYFIRYAEYGNGAFGKLYSTFDTPLLALPGGLNRVDADFLEKQAIPYFQFQQFNKRFLTWAPLEKKTFPGVPERLFFFCQSEGMHVKIKITYLDGSISETEKYTDETVKNNVIELLTGTYALFSADDTETIDYYEVWIVEDGTDKILSETRKYNIDHNYFENIRVLAFKNSFEMFDTLALTGKLTSYDHVKRTTIEKDTETGLRKVVKHAENNVSYQVSSGWLKGKESRQWLEEILLSREMYLITGSFLLPLVNTTGKVERQNDDNNLYSIVLTFEPDYNNVRYSAIKDEDVVYVEEYDSKIFSNDQGELFIY